MFPFSKIIVVCWIIFWLYWLISAFGNKKSTKQTASNFIGIRFGMFFILIILFHILNIHTDSFRNRLASNNEIILTVSLIIFLLGLFIAIWARLNLGKNWGTPMSVKQNPQLVTSGPYRYVRHPIYTGILLAMVGSITISSFYWLAVFVISGIYFFFCATQEEKIMMKQFPKVYPSYKAKTKMLIPFIF
jgi:protein-S-isoprenylcysteine O-methyltransferase Ste14